MRYWILILHLYPKEIEKNVGIGTTANSKNIVNNLSEKEKQIEQAEQRK